MDRDVLSVDALSSIGAKPSQYIRTSDEAHGGRRFSALDNTKIATPTPNVDVPPALRPKRSGIGRLRSVIVPIKVF